MQEVLDMLEREFDRSGSLDGISAHRKTGFYARPRRFEVRVASLSWTWHQMSVHSKRDSRMSCVAVARSSDQSLAYSDDHAIERDAALASLDLNQS